MEEKEINSQKLACVIAQILDDKLGKDITILNISHVSSLADYFVIASGDSTPQVKALMESVKDKIKKHFSQKCSPEEFIYKLIIFRLYL